MATDAKMVVAEDGRLWGTVGGGCIEADVIGAATEVAACGEPRFVSHTLTADSAGDLGLSCGGTAEFFLEPIVRSPEMVELYSRVATAIRERTPMAVITGVDWSTGPKKVIRFFVGQENRDQLAVGDFEVPATLDEKVGRGRSTYFDEETGLLIE